MSGNEDKLGNSELKLISTNCSTTQKDLKNAVKKELWGTRHTMALMSFLGMGLFYAMRVDISVAIVAMVRPTNYTANSNATQAACPLPDDYNDDVESGKRGEFDWDAQTQGIVLGSFYYGYTCTNILGGLATERYGGRLVLGISMLLTGIFAILSPIAAQSSSTALIAVNALGGASQGVSFPAINSLLASWVLPVERTKYASFIYSGLQFGTVVVLATGGYLSASDFLGGWPSIFYIYGGLGFVWTVLWFYLIRDTPATHPRISQQELEFLQPVSLLQTSGKKVVPWRSIIRSVPLWGTLAAHVGGNWGFNTLLAELPTYLDKIQHFSLSSSGLLSALPYATMYIFSQIYSQAITKLNTSGVISTLNVRKISMAIAGYIPTVALVGLCFVGCDRIAVIVVLCVAVGACGALFSGVLCSHADLAPRYAGILMALTNTFATLPGFISPLLTGAITNNNQTLNAWRIVFLLAAVIYAVSTTIYILTISVDIQPWNYYKTDKPKEKECMESVHQITDDTSSRNSSVNKERY